LIATFFFHRSVTELVFGTSFFFAGFILDGPFSYYL
jgi:hypothetical protein